LIGSWDNSGHSEDPDDGTLDELLDNISKKIANKSKPLSEAASASGCED
jgi:hypothetical protein